MVTRYEAMAYADAHRAAEALERIAVALEALRALAEQIAQKGVDIK